MHRPEVEWCASVVINGERRRGMWVTERAAAEADLRSTVALAELFPDMTCVDGLILRRTWKTGGPIVTTYEPGAEAKLGRR